MKLASTVLGSGPRATVLLHGFLGSGRNLRTLATRWLAADPSRKILLVDLPGHGESPVPAEDETLGSMAKSVIDTARAEGLQGPLTWVGHSLGGRVSLSAIGVEVSAVEQVIMLDISPSPIATEVSASGAVLNSLRRAPESAKDRTTMRAWLLEQGGLSSHLVEWLLLNLQTVDGGVRWRIDREALHRLHLRVNREDLWPLVEARERPVACIKGSRSNYVTPEDEERLKLYGVQVFTVEAGHYVHTDALDALLGHLVELTR